METVHISQAQLAAILEALGRGDRVEIIPVKDGVRIIRIQKALVKYLRAFNPAERDQDSTITCGPASVRA